jgi:hypothetical protein
MLEERFYLRGFVPAEVVLIKKDVWFKQLSSNQLDSLNEYLLEQKKRLSILMNY